MDDPRLQHPLFDRPGPGRAIKITVSAILIVVSLSITSALIVSKVNQYRRPAMPRGVNIEALHLLLTNAPVQDIAASIERDKVDINTVEWAGMTMLTLTIFQNRLDVARWLLDHGADPNGKAPHSVPLYLAVRNDNIDAVRLLLEAGADPNHDMGGGVTVLMMVGTRDVNPAILRLLRAHD